MIDLSGLLFLCLYHSLGHLYDWFKVIASHPSVGDDLYTSSAFFVATGKLPLPCGDRSVLSVKPCFLDGVY